MRPAPDRLNVAVLGRLLPALCVCLPLAVAQAAGSGVFKWVDRDGVVRYDDQSLLAERITRATIARGSVAADARATVPEDLVIAVAEQCSDLKERAAAYRDARYVYARDPVGNQYLLSSNQVALEVAGLQQEARRYCRPLAAQYLLAELRAAQRVEETPTGQVRSEAADR